LFLRSPRIVSNATEANFRRWERSGFFWVQLSKGVELGRARDRVSNGSVPSIQVRVRVQTEEFSREYNDERADRLDQRLEKIEKQVAKLAPVNMAKMIENAMSACMEKMVDQLTDRVVKRSEDMVEESRKQDEIRRGKQVEATPEEETISDVEFEPGATFSMEENQKVERVIREEMEVERQELEQSKHAPVIPPGGVRGEFPRLEVGQVTILIKTPVVPAVPQQQKKVVKKPEEVIPRGPKAGGKKPEVKKPVIRKPEGKKPEDKKKERWAQKAAAPPPPKKNPGQGQLQQCQGEKKKSGDGFQEVKRGKKDEMKPVPQGQNSMEKRRVKRNTRGCLTTITTPGATAEMLIRYREIVIRAAQEVDAGIVDIETNEPWARVKMHGVNFNRYLGNKTGGGVEKLTQELQAENEWVVLALAITWIRGPKDVQKKKGEGKKASLVVFAVKGSEMAEKVLKGGLRAAGVKYDVERFVTAGLDSFCGVCSRWGNVEAKCGA
jgi:hypothetical protein